MDRKALSLQRQRHLAHAEHVLERLVLRYGIQAEQADLSELVELAKEVKGQWQGIRKTCKVPWRGKTIKLIYDSYVDFIVKVLPLQLSEVIPISSEISSEEERGKH